MCETLIGFVSFGFVAVNGESTCFKCILWPIYPVKMKTKALVIWRACVAC